MVNIKSFRKLVIVATAIALATIGYADEKKKREKVSYISYGTENSCTAASLIDNLKVNHQYYTNISFDPITINAQNETTNCEPCEALKENVTSLNADILNVVKDSASIDKVQYTDCDIKTIDLQANKSTDKIEDYKSIDTKVTSIDSKSIENKAIDLQLTTSTYQIDDYKSIDIQATNIEDTNILDFDPLYYIARQVYHNDVIFFDDFGSFNSIYQIYYNSDKVDQETKERLKSHYNSLYEKISKRNMRLNFE
jgi:hypothetical protein